MDGHSQCPRSYDVRTGSRRRVPRPRPPLPRRQRRPAARCSRRRRPSRSSSRKQAAGAIPVDDAKKTELQQKAAAFADELAGIDAKSPEFTKKVESITSMGDKDLRASANVSSRMLDGPPR